MENIWKVLEYKIINGILKMVKFNYVKKLIII